MSNVAEDGKLEGAELGESMYSEGVDELGSTCGVSEGNVVGKLEQT